MRVRRWPELENYYATHRLCTSTSQQSNVENSKELNRLLQWSQRYPASQADDLLGGGRTALAEALLHSKSVLPELKLGRTILITNHFVWTVDEVGRVAGP